MSSSPRHTTTATRPCTCCTVPAVVDLGDAFWGRNNDDDASSSSSFVLRHNLTHYGWTRVQITTTDPRGGHNVDDNDDDYTTTAKMHQLLQQSPAQWKAQLVALFPTTKNHRAAQLPPEVVTYRAAESGAPGTVEPKESLEIQRRRTSPPSFDKAEALKNVQLLDAYTNLLHQVACAVRQALNLPANVLLHEEEENKDGDHATTTPIDLMRVFYYQTVDASMSNSSAVWGSSAHTDWGSFTVVWQDDVGGLQTYCHACHQWVDVGVTSGKTSSHQSKVWEFVVHVGDFTSICVGRALQEQQQSQQQQQQQHDDDYATATTTVVWPSPQHRVVSPTTQRRLSLVYFAYPPAHATLQGMQDALHDWCRDNHHSIATARVRVPWEDYFVLRNQSSSTGNKNGIVISPHDVYEKIATLAVRDVLEDKWNQVQR